MTTVTVSTALDRITRLIPVRSATLWGDSVWVLTSPGILPVQFRDVQRERTAHYMSDPDPLTARTAPFYAPRYFVTYSGVLIAWVTLNGHTHFTSPREVCQTLDVPYGSPTGRAVFRHVDTIRAAWPAAFTMDSQGDPVL